MASTIKCIPTIQISASAKPNGTTTSSKKAPLAVVKKRLGVPALVAGLAAAQLSLFSPAPALADIYASNPAVGSLADTMGVITEITDSEIPQLEARLGKLASNSGEASQMVVAAAEKSLESIEREAAMLAESSMGDGTNDADGSIAAKAAGILDQISSVKSMMRGVSGMQ